jgi:hypothetical protein
LQIALWWFLYPEEGEIVQHLKALKLHGMAQSWSEMVGQAGALLLHD